MIDTSTNSVIATVNVGLSPYGVAVTPDGEKIYVTNSLNNTTSVIDTTTYKVTAIETEMNQSDGNKVYVTIQAATMFL